MSTLKQLEYGNVTDPFYVEYVARTGTFSMTQNHMHPYYEIYYLLSGERDYFIKDTTYRIQQGDLVFIPKYELHQTLHAGEPTHERMIIHLHDHFLDAAAGQHSKLLLRPFQQKSPILRLSQEEQEITQNHIRRIRSEIQHTPAGCELYLQYAIVDLLLVAARSLQHQKPIPSYETPLHKKISDLIRYLNANYAAPIHLPKLAEQFYISPYYLSRTFKEVTGFTLMSYLNLTRIKEAQRLLRDTDMKIIDIAMSVGFDNFSHFGKTFKAIAHTSPRAYRQSCKNAPDN